MNTEDACPDCFSNSLSEGVCVCVWGGGGGYVAIDWLEDHSISR